MDPLTALSLSCNILDLVEKAVKCGLALKRIHDKGSTEDHDGLRTALETMEVVVSGLENSQSRPRFARRELQEQMDRLLTHSIHRCTLLKDLLSKCQPERAGSWRAASWATVRTILNKSEIDRVYKELSEDRAMVETLIVTETSESVDQIKTQLESIGVKTNDISQMLGLLRNTLGTHNQNIQEQLNTIKNALLEAEDAAKNRLILQALSFPTMDTRYREVQEAEVNTFNWIFNDPDFLMERVPTLKTTFVDWLQSGSGIFHVVGKAGSGKSTLMKFLCEEDETDALLHAWARSGRKQLVFCRFFFWNVTSVAEQKTLKGLIRSLLHDLLQQVPTLSSQLFPKYWTKKTNITGGTAKFDLSDREIRAAFELLMGTPEMLENLQLRLCFFIDGLDEFEQDLKLQRETYYDLANQLKSWTDNSRGNVKMCVSSRPLPEFTQTFAASQQITLQALTRHDIETLVNNELGKNSLFIDLIKNSRRNEERCEYLLRELVEESNGVFLWVVLVVHQLKQALVMGDSIDVLERIVTSSSKELNEFFKRILLSIPQHHQKVTYYVLAAVMRMSGIPTSNAVTTPRLKLLARKAARLGPRQYLTLEDCALIFECADANNHTFLDFDMDMAWRPMGFEEDEEWQTRVKKQLNSRCRGLVEVKMNPLSPENSSLVILFTHRAIPEALQSFFEGLAADEAVKDEGIEELLAWLFLAEMRDRWPRTRNVKERLALWRRMEHLIGQLRIRDLTGCNRLFRIIHEVDGVLQAKTFTTQKWSRQFWDHIWHPIRLDASWKVLWICQHSCLHEYVGWVLDEILSFPEDKLTVLMILVDTIIQSGEETNWTLIEPSCKFIFKKLAGKGVTLESPTRPWSKANSEQPCMVWYQFAAIQFFFWKISTQWRPVEILLSFGADPEIFLTATDRTGTVSGPNGRVLSTARKESFGKDNSTTDLTRPLRPGISLRDFVQHHKPSNVATLLSLIDINLAKKKEREAQAGYGFEEEFDINDEKSDRSDFDDILMNGVDSEDDRRRKSTSEAGSDISDESSSGEEMEENSALQRAVEYIAKTRSAPGTDHNKAIFGDGE